MFIKLMIVFVLLLIFAAIGSAMLFLVRGHDQKTVRALTLRIGLSLCLFIFLLLAYRFHWLTPHGLITS